MLTLFKLFGKSPFAPLKIHMEKVAQCVGLLEELFHTQFAGNNEKVVEIAHQISHLEHEADQTKNYIRNHLTKGLFLLVDRADLLDILSIQDSIADKAEDIGVLLTLRPLMLSHEFQNDFFPFLKKNLLCFKEAFKIMQELDQLLETSFGGSEAEKVKQMTETVSFLEHEADLLQEPLLKKLFNQEEAVPYPVFHLWLKVFESVGQIANLSEKLANRIRMLLEVK